jgi:hypothetical protein
MTPTVSIVMTDRTDVEPELDIINTKRSSNGLQTATLVSLAVLAEQAYDPAIYYLENTDGSEVRACYVSHDQTVNWVLLSLYS